MSLMEFFLVLGVGIVIGAKYKVIKNFITDKIKLFLAKKH